MIIKDRPELGYPMPRSGLRQIGTDRQGRIHVVKEGSGDTVHVYDATRRELDEVVAAADRAAEERTQPVMQGGVPRDKWDDRAEGIEGLLSSDRLLGTYPTSEIGTVR
jgi:hypothetical protein